MPFGVLVAMLLFQTPAKTAPVTIFLTAPMRDGFVDAGKGIQDSLKDLENSLDFSFRKDFTIVDSRADAAIVVTIMGRGVGPTEFAGVWASANANSFVAIPIKSNTYWVASILEVGAYRKEMVATRTQAGSLGVWSKCANDLAKDLQAWKKANAAQLEALRIKK